MAIEVARYQFLSWARKGISAQINELDVLADPARELPAGERATVPIGVSINTVEQPAKQFALVGPGDIVGIHRDMIVRTEPRNWISNFEPNYLAFVEFYDEDFPWRYTPARPDGERLRPWLALLVLEDSEFQRDDRRVPLPVITVKAKDALPPLADSWLFAHVHTDQDLGAGELSDLESYLNSLRAAVTTDPDRIYSRLMCPRHLAANRAYSAFVVPAFEAGRLAGLGKDSKSVPAQKPAWDAATTGLELPVYFDWTFRTGNQVDFEALVELLKPRILDKRIGIRTMDCATPGFVKVDGAGRERPLPPGETRGLPAPFDPEQGLEGALKTKDTRPDPEIFTANAFQTELEILVNLPETIAAVAGPAVADDEFLSDPVVTLTFYGQNHARQRREDKLLLDTDSDAWLHDLNRDPRTRVPAGFGTNVIQKNQERLMQMAWEQVQKVYDANRILRPVRFILEVSTFLVEQSFKKLAPAELIAIAAPIHPKVLGSPTTIRQQLSESRLVSPLFSAAFRRMVRPAGRLATRIGRPDTASILSRAVDAVNEGRATPAPPRAVPKDLPSLDALAARIQPLGLPSWLRWALHHPLLAALLLAALLLAALLFAGALVFLSGTALAAAAVGVLIAAGAAYAWLAEEGRRLETAEALVDPARAAAAIERTGPRPDFSLLPAEEDAAPAPAPAPRPETTPGPGAGARDRDSADAANFRAAALRLERRSAIRAPEKAARRAFDLPNGAQKLSRAIDPRISFPRRAAATVKIPGVALEQPEEIVDVIAHPDFEEAMYAHLRDISKELLIPNLNLIPPDTISLLVTNPRFIESYLVGLNHEMGREMLWREYPTDLRGSYFRQFWDVKGVSNPDTPADAELLKDIIRIHRWPAASRLGSHKPPPGPRADVQPGEEQVVLVVRGELLKRYPNTVIYAQKAIDDGQGNPAIRETDLTPDQFDIELKFPLFRAEIDPDLRFFGFDLTMDKATGAKESIDFPGDTRGWFFVIQEVPGEPRFGMDIAYSSTENATPTTTDDLDDWDNLAWNSFGAAEPAFVPRSPAPVLPRPNQAELDKHPWAESAAQMAYALYQNPVMVAVHASEMLDLADD